VFGFLRRHNCSTRATAKQQHDFVWSLSLACLFVLTCTNLPGLYFAISFERACIALSFVFALPCLALSCLVVLSEQSSRCIVRTEYEVLDAIADPAAI
jgi:hypothetical protein